MTVTIEDIARHIGVHPSTVSRAMNGSPRVSESRRQQVLAAAESLGYRANIMSRGLLGKRTDTFGIIAPKLDDLHAISLINAQEAFFREMGCVTILTITNCEEQAELKAIDNLISRAVDGLVMNYVSMYASVKAKLIECAQRIPIVRIGGNSQGVLDEVDVDFNKWSCAVVNHLIEYGHRRIAMIVDSIDYEDGEGHNTKLAGYRKSLSLHNIEYNPALVFSVHYLHQNIKHLMQQIMSLKERPTAIFAYSDDLAGGLIKALTTAGYKVPEDVSVVGFNDDWFADRLAVSLTTCRLPANEIGRGAAELLIRRRKNRTLPPVRRMYECQVVIRDSTARHSDTAV
jgi:LacI family transcriptional regulator